MRFVAREEPGDDGRSERGSSHQHIGLLRACGGHVRSGGRELHLRSASGLHQHPLPRIHRGHADHARPRRRIQRRRRRTVVADCGHDQVAARQHVLNDGGEHGVRRAHEAHVDDRDVLPGQPPEGLGHRIHRAARGPPAEHVRRVQSRARRRAVEGAGATDHERGHRRTVLGRHRGAAAVLLDRDAVEHLVRHVDAAVDEADAGRAALPAIRVRRAAGCAGRDGARWDGRRARALQPVWECLDAVSLAGWWLPSLAVGRHRTGTAAVR